MPVIENSKGSYLAVSLGETIYDPGKHVRLSPKGSEGDSVELNDEQAASESVALLKAKKLVTLSGNTVRNRKPSYRTFSVPSDDPVRTVSHVVLAPKGQPGSSVTVTDAQAEQPAVQRAIESGAVDSDDNGGGSEPADSETDFSATPSGSYRLIEDLVSTFVVPEGSVVKLDLDGHSIVPEKGDAIVVKGELAISDRGEIRAKSAGSAAIAVFPGAKATLKGGAYSSDKWYVIKNLGEMEIDGGVTVKGTDGNASSLIDNGWYGGTDTVAGEKVPAQDGKAFLTIRNGKFDGKSGDKSCSVVKNDDYGMLKIEGGTFDSTSNKGVGPTQDNASIILNWNVATIDGGEFKGLYLCNGGYGEDGPDKGQLTVNGGDFDTAPGVSALGYAKGSMGGLANVAGGTWTQGIKENAVDGQKMYDISITGGDFGVENDAACIADGYEQVEADGIWSVSKKKATRKRSSAKKSA